MASELLFPPFSSILGVCGLTCLQGLALIAAEVKGIAHPFPTPSPLQSAWLGSVRQRCR